MEKNLLEKKNYMQTAGKITIATAFFGIMVFASVFLFNAGTSELKRVDAQSATTTLTVLNTPPVWIASTTEMIESSTSTPTNSSFNVSWRGVADDPNQATYYMLICQSSAAPSSTNGGAPRCNGGTQWGVSAATPVNTQAIVSTTTVEGAVFPSGPNNWYAWVCDDDSVNARCNAAFSQGTNATNSSPFVVNYRPTFTNFTNNSPANPGGLVTFYATSSDVDTTPDNLLFLTVCSTASYSTTTGCAANTLGTTSIGVLDDPTAVYTLPAIMIDTTYNAYGYVRDQFNHTAIGAYQGTSSPFIVSNVAPTVANGSITLNGTSSLSLSVPAGLTTGFRLDFTTSDANNCRSSSTTLEVRSFVASVYRSGVGTSSCSGASAGQHNPNNCYPSAVATTTWNLNCVASTTSCSALPTVDATMDWSCTFPLWFLADPTDVPNTQFEPQNWLAAVAGVDDNNATGTLGVSSSGKEVISFPYLALLAGNGAIPYGQLEPGQQNATLSASTTVVAQGNTGINNNLNGYDMCITLPVGSCPLSASSTIPADEQRFGTSSVAYASGTTLATSTPKLNDIRVPKPTSTTTASLPNRTNYWGIRVPSSITLAGSYTGQNTITVITSASSTW